MLSGLELNIEQQGVEGLLPSGQAPLVGSGEAPETGFSAQWVLVARLLHDSGTVCYCRLHIPTSYYHKTLGQSYTFKGCFMGSYHLLLKSQVLEGQVLE